MGGSNTCVNLPALITAVAAIDYACPVPGTEDCWCASRNLQRGTSPPVIRFNATEVADWLKDLAAAMSAEPTVDAAIQRVLELNRLAGLVPCAIIGSLRK